MVATIDNISNAFKNFISFLKDEIKTNKITFQKNEADTTSIITADKIVNNNTTINSTGINTNSISTETLKLNNTTVNLSDYVKTVNNNAPDSNGNITIEENKNFETVTAESDLSSTSNKIQVYNNNYYLQNNKMAKYSDVENNINLSTMSASAYEAATKSSNTIYVVSTNKSATGKIQEITQSENYTYTYNSTTYTIINTSGTVSSTVKLVTDGDNNVYYDTSKFEYINYKSISNYPDVLDGNSLITYTELTDDEKKELQQANLTQIYEEFTENNNVTTSTFETDKTITDKVSDTATKKTYVSMITKLTVENRITTPSTLENVELYINMTLKGALSDDEVGDYVINVDTTKNYQTFTYNDKDYILLVKESDTSSKYYAYLGSYVHTYNAPENVTYNLVNAYEMDSSDYYIKNVYQYFSTPNILYNKSPKSYSEIQQIVDDTEITYNWVDKNVYLGEIKIV